MLSGAVLRPLCRCAGAAETQREAVSDLRLRVFHCGSKDESPRETVLWRVSARFDPKMIAMMSSAATASGGVRDNHTSSTGHDWSCMVVVVMVVGTSQVRCS